MSVFPNATGATLKKDLPMNLLVMKIQRLFRKFFWLPALLLTVAASAAAAETPVWYRLRTNSVPYHPESLTVDSAGGVWVTAAENFDYQYDMGVWYLPPENPEARFQHFTDDPSRNDLQGVYDTIVAKPSLDTHVRYAVKDGRGNVWYALNDRRVLCEKADGTWLTVPMPETSDPGADSAHRIRLIDRPDETQLKMLISIKGIVVVGADFNISETRGARSDYNNDFIYDALIDSQGRYWVASGRGIETGPGILQTAFAADIAAYADDPDVPPTETPITCIAEDSRQNLWFINSTYGAEGVYCLTTGGDWRKFDLDVLTGARNTVTCLAAGADGTVWFGPLNSGLVSYAPAETETWTRITGAELGLKSESLLCLAEADDRLWFATDINPGVSGNGTGVHALTLSGWSENPQVKSYTYRESSTSLTSNRIAYLAADLSGGVWFPAYDDPSVARLKADGAWEQFRTDAMDSTVVPGTGGIPGVGVDSNNIVFFAPQRAAPIAYDVGRAQWLSLPPGPAPDNYFYSLYVDPNDGKWFCGADVVYHLDAGNTVWTAYDTTDTSKFPDYRVERALMDDDGSMWFMTFYGICRMKNDPEGGNPTWHTFKSGDNSGYTGGYRLHLDDVGRVWNSSGQVFQPDSNTWTTAQDTAAFDCRLLRFGNGRIPADMNLADALPPVTTVDPDRMALDTAGNVYFAGGMVGLASINTGVVVCRPIRGDIDRNASVDLADAILTIQIASAKASEVQSMPAALSGNGRIGLAESIYVLQKVAGHRSP